MLHVFPVRHHSPASSLLVSEFIKQVYPKLILIEGPSDANHLIDILTETETEPPVAILAHYLPDNGEPRYILYPFASYSPELVALNLAKTLNIPVRFIDIPSSVSIQFYNKYEQMIEADTFFSDLTSRSGYRSFEEFWEAAFENGGMNVEGFITAMLDYAGLLRKRSAKTPTEEFQKDLFREQFMSAEITRAMSEGYKSEEILVICGAFHAAALADNSVGAKRIPPDPPLKKGGTDHPPFSDEKDRVPPFSKGGSGGISTKLTVIPYSYPRLSEQLGYGAGNRAPLYYEKVYHYNGDFSAASLETMVAFMNYLHFKGYGVSLANVIEANRLAKILANMRGKRAPGLEEIKEALTACLLHGSGEVADRFLWDLMVGRSVGKVSSKIGKTSLQQEFYREANQRKIPLTDSVQEFILHLHNPTEIGTSIFLHRLRLCQIPFARNKETVTSAYDYLSGAKEKWEVQWTPAVDACLVEKSLLGNSLVEVCQRMLKGKLNEAQNARDAAESLLEIAICDVKNLFQEALSACDFLAAEDNDFFSLAKACQNLHALVSYGSSRELNPEEFMTMLTRTFNRAVLLLLAASKVADDGVEQVCEGVTILSDLCHRSKHVNQDLLYATIQELIDSYTAHPKVAGLAASIVHLAKILDEERVHIHLNQRLSGGNEPLNGAFFLEGFLSLNKTVLVRNRPIIQLLDGFAQAIRPDDFVIVLPVLRRAFADLTRSELNYFLEHLSSIHKIEETKMVKAVTEAQIEKLQELNQLSQDLDDLF